MQIIYQNGCSTIICSAKRALEVYANEPYNRGRMKKFRLAFILIVSISLGVLALFFLLTERASLLPAIYSLVP